jgi:hypothetical protein
MFKNRDVDVTVPNQSEQGNKNTGQIVSLTTLFPASQRHLGRHLYWSWPRALGKLTSGKWPVLNLAASNLEKYSKCAQHFMITTSPRIHLSFLLSDLDRDRQDLEFDDRVGAIIKCCSAQVKTLAINRAMSA